MGRQVEAMVGATSVGVIAAVDGLLPSAQACRCAARLAGCLEAILTI